LKILNEGESYSGVYGMSATCCSYGLQVAEEIWVCENGTVTKWPGDIQTYKEHLKEKIVKDKASCKKQFK